jgi:acyl dehydratase
MTTTSTPTIGRLLARVGQELGVSAWREVPQSAVDAFAEVTGDHQWIHTDADRAAASPFGGTIAHGYFTLALAPVLLEEVLPLDQFAFAVNYGLNKLRFPSPLPVGDRVRMRVRLDDVEEFDGGATLTLTLAFERAGGDRPVAIAQALYRIFDADGERS